MRATRGITRCQASSAAPERMRRRQDRRQPPKANKTARSPETYRRFAFEAFRGAAPVRAALFVGVAFRAVDRRRGELSPLGSAAANPLSSAAARLLVARSMILANMAPVSPPLAGRFDCQIAGVLPA